MENCLFCKIVEGTIPSSKVYEDENCFAFRDISPQAAIHILIVPKEHMANVLECSDRTDGLLEKLYAAAVRIAREQGMDEKGFRLVTNCGEYGAQSVQHFHIHLLGGEQLSGKMS